MKLRKTWLAVALGVGEIGLAGSGPAHAQDIRIDVTGTNIRRVDTETAAPIQTITREDIQASGLQTIQDVVRQITANNNGSISPSFANGFSASGTGVSLRGLGPNNTLVLVNGRRMANFGLADDGHISYVDLSQIPFDAVDRIEVLKDGASAIYGSDAVAGVVNVILRQQYTGFTATGTVGTNYNGEGNQWKAALTAGIGDLTRDRYNAFVTLDYQKQDGIPMNMGRDYVGTNDLRFMGKLDARYGNPNSGFYGPGLLGNVAPVSAADPYGPAGEFQALRGYCSPASQDNGFCRWDAKDYLDILPTIERANVYARGAYNVTGTMQAYTELSYFHVKTTLRQPPWSTYGWTLDPSTNTLKDSTTVYLPVAHPDNPFAAANEVARLWYADAALGPADTHATSDTQRYLVGLKGTNKGWDWDLAGLYIRTATETMRENLYQYDNLLAGLAGTGPYGFYRIGASAPLNNPAIYDWIAPDLSYKAVSSNTIVDAKASRDLVKLDGGQLALAVGYEFHREELDNPGFPGTDTGNVVSGNPNRGLGSRNVNAVYGEIFAPIVKGLEVSAAIRYDHYSDFGSTWNPKIGVKWTALPSLVLRGTWETSFRAPGLYETSATNAYAAAPVVVDPVRCPVTGSPADCQAIITAILTGNPSIGPQTSTAYTLGAIWEPLPGLSATLDYWNFVVKDQITFGSTQAIVNDPAAFPNSQVGRDINDLPGIPDSGTILYVRVPFQNANSLDTDGIDLDVVWKWNLKEYGNVAAELQWTHIFNYSQTFDNGLTYKYAGVQGNYDLSSGSSTPEDRINLILTWQRGPWNVTGTVRYVSDYTSIPYQGAPIPDGCLSILDSPSCHVPSFTTLDLSASYSGAKNWQVFGSIINVFNRMPPFNPAAGYGNINYNYNYAISGATGTQFNLGARYTFQ